MKPESSPQSELIRTRRHIQDRVSKYADPNSIIAEVKGEKFWE